ncbi:hypothetical protein [Herbiconiux sp. YIM B11900]|uniref:hypothetical protein n=1 Tax=Herbiconiux sp. YIM B11900 TaxID=3404131 RepID=UPI003F878B27
MGGAELDISALGVRVRVGLDAVADQGSRRSLRELWQDAAFAPNAADDRTVRLRAVIDDPADRVRASRLEHGAEDVLAPDLRSLASALSSRVTLAAIEARKADLVMLHACGVATPDGAVYAFVGPSGRGKTTLAAALGRVFGYVSDETIGVRADGAVTPYRKPLSVIEPGSAPGKTQRAPSELGLLALPDEPLHIAAITLIERDAERDGPAEVTETGMVEAITSIIPELSYLPHLTRPLQRLAGLIDRIGGVRRLRYHEASTVASQMLPLRRPARSEPSWMPLPAAAAGRTPAPGQFARVEPLDAIAVEGAYVLLHGSDVRVLDGIGPAIWDALAEPAGVQTVTAQVVRSLGEPASGDPEAIVSAALLDLAESGILLQGTDPGPRSESGRPA